MAVVFRWEEIRDGKMPMPEAFAEIRDRLANDLPKVRGFAGAVLCGSAANGKGTIRSDFDGIVAFEDAHWLSMQGYMRKLHLRAKRISVPLDVRCIGMDFVRNGRHGVSMSFADHLTLNVTSGNEIGEFPVHEFAFMRSDRKAEVAEYIARKIANFRFLSMQLPALEGQILHRFLRKLLEAPLHAARKILWLKGLLHGDDSRQAVISAWDGPSFDNLTATDDAYTAEVMRQAESADRERYMEALLDIVSRTNECIGFLTDCLKIADSHRHTV